MDFLANPIYNKLPSEKKKSSSSIFYTLHKDGILMKAGTICNLLVPTVSNHKKQIT